MRNSPFWCDGFYDEGQPSEYTHGSGLTPRGLEMAAPDCGGMYAAKAPGIALETRNTRTGYAGIQVRT